jgi:hypothetical protein
MKVRMMARRRMTLTEALLYELHRYINELKQNEQWFVFKQKKGESNE